MSFGWLPFPLDVLLMHILLVELIRITPGSHGGALKLENTEDGLDWLIYNSWHRFTWGKEEATFALEGGDDDSVLEFDVWVTV